MKSYSTRKTRYVQVVVADVNSQIPVEKRLLLDKSYVTDECNEDIRVSLGLSELVAQTNEVRASIVDKRYEDGRTLKEIRPSDLKVVIRDVVSFS